MPTEQDPKGPLQGKLDPVTRRQFIAAAKRLGIRRPHTAARVVLTVFARSEEVAEVIRQHLHLSAMDPEEEQDEEGER